MRRLLPLAVLASVLPFAGCGDDGATQPTTSEATTTEASEPIEGEEGPALYFTSGEQFRKVEREGDFSAYDSEQQKLEAAAEMLVEGPTKAERSADVEVQTQIPAGTEVKGVKVDDDGTAVVDVTPEFTAKVADDSELDARLAQVTYTLTQFPGVEATKVVAGGKPVEPELERQDLAKPAHGPKRPKRAKGERGSSVRALQERLAELRYLPKRAVDGVDGYRTQQAVIAFQSWRGLERDGIVGPATKAALAKASPPKPKANGPSRRIEVFREKGVALLIGGGKTKRAIHVSTGGPGNETPAGSYEVFRKELKSWSVPFQTWLPYASYFNNGIAFHEYPDVPTYPASHGCVRVPAPEAKGVYKFAAIGTAVIVF